MNIGQQIMQDRNIGMKKLKDLRKGEWFTLKDIQYPSENQVYIKGEYDRTEKKYCCHKWGDINSDRLIKGDKEVYTDFIF